MKRILLLSLFLFAFYLIGCDDGSTNPEGEILWPMEVGNQWIGIREYHDFRGYPFRTELDTISIVKAVDIDGETWYEFDDGIIRRNREDGVWTRAVGGLNRIYLGMIAKYPTIPGDTFQSERFTTIGTGGQQGTGVEWIETLSTDSVCAVPMGKLRCHVYKTFVKATPHFVDDQQAASWALAPGVGPVIMTGYSGKDTAGYVWKLEKTNVR